VPEVALPELIFYALLFLALAFAWASRKLTQALFGNLISALQSIPAIGSTLAAPFQYIERAIIGACESIESGCDSLMGAAWHATARLLDWSWREIRSHAGAIAALATPIGLLIAGYHALRALIHHLAGIGHVASAAVKTLEREYHGIEHRVRAIEREIARGIGHDLRIQVKALEQEVTGLEQKVIPDIRAIADTAEADVTALQQWVSKNAVLVGTSILTGAVAWALGQLGLGGLRCNGLLNSLKNRGCGLWNGLEDILGLLVDTAVLLNVCDLIGPLEAVVSDVAAPVVVTLTDIGAGLCAGGIGAPPALPVPNLHLPANPGIVLDLP
jgi:hypothetical protein